MKKPAVIASAFALACGLSAFAGSASWFDAKISTYTDAAAWNTTAGIMGGSWAEGALDAATLDTTGEAAKLVVDADETAPLKFNATEGRAPADGAVTVNSKITFNAFESTSLPDVPDGAKAGIIAVKTGDTTYAFYGLVKDGDANAWKPLAGAAPESAEDLANVPVAVTVAQVPDSDPVAYTVTYKVNDTLLSYNEATAIPVIAGEITAASYSGCGEVSALSSEYYVPTGKFELGNFTRDSDTFLVASVVNAATGETIDVAEEGSIELPAGTVVRVNFAIRPGVQKDFTGNAFVERTVIKDDFVGVEVDSEDLPVVDDANAKIGSVYYLTLAKAVFNATNGDTVELLGDEVGTNMDVTASCTIDLGNFTYTYASGLEFKYQIDVSGGNTVTIQNGTIKNAVERRGGCLIRSYATKLTINNVTLDATGVQSMTVEYPTRDNYLGVIAATSGDLEIAGTTTVINTAAGVNAISFGNYAGGYTMGTLTIGTTGSIAGDVLLTGGAIAAYSDKVSGHYYIGANAQTVFAAAPETFGAMIGEFASVTTAVAYVINKTGEICKDFAAANAAAVATDTVTLRANVSLSAATEFKGATLVPGANKITLADAAASLTYKDNSLRESFETSVDGKEVQYVNGAYVVADPAPAGFIFTLTATGINGKPSYTIGVGGAAIPFVGGESGVWTSGLLPAGATFTVAYGTAIKVPVATWSNPVNVTDQGKGVFLMGSGAASATLTITDAGSVTPTEEQAAEAIAQGADAALPNPGDRAAFDTNIKGIQSTKLASWLSGNAKVTYPAIAAASDPADVKVSCELGAEQVVADPTLTLTSLESTEKAGEFTIKVKLTSGSSTDAIAYATAAVKELFQATYSLGTPAWSGENVTAVPVPESGAEAAFTVAPADTTKPAAFIRIAK